jgi:transposase
VYVDECGVHTFLQREYARAPRGEPIEDSKRGTHFDRENIIGALNGRDYCAVECYRQTTNGDFFEAWFTDSLLQALPAGEGYTVIMDNARFHRKEELRKLARGKVKVLFLPPYSPDYNPIEKSWANMKRYLRSNLRDYQSVKSAIYDFFGVSGV